MNTVASERDPVEQLAEEFLERHRRGERPTITEYTRAHPELEARIHDLFPAIMFLEQMGAAQETPTPTVNSTASKLKLPARLGDYRIVREIGRGGMGVVFEAVHEPLGRQVALKVLPDIRLANATYRERFQREARAAARLHHTNIVPVFGVGEQAGVLYFAMQFIDGKTLDAVLREVVRLRRTTNDSTNVSAADSVATSMATGLQTGQFGDSRSSVIGPVQPMSSAQAKQTERGSHARQEYYRGVARIGVAVAQALTHAHQQGILHRDIKPSNLLLDTQGTVWVTDFGLAKMEGADELTDTGDVVGTLRYMAPERFRGQSDPQSDIYGLGITLYELLTLRPAFIESSRPELSRHILHDDPTPPRQIDQGIPRDLETIVGKAMAKDPVDRYPSAQSLADDLQRFIADRPIQARRSPLSERCWRWCRRNPRLAVMTGAVALLFLVIAIGSPLMSVRLWEQRQQAREELWNAQIARAESQRLTAQAGRRFQGLATLDEARHLLPSLRSEPDRELTLRNQFIACLSLADLGVAHRWDGYPEWSTGVAFDPNLVRYARSDCQGNISIREIASDREIARLLGPGQAAWSLRFSPDGRFLAAGYQCAHQDPALQVQVWNCDSQQSIVQVKSTSACGEAGFSLDSRFVAIGRDEKTLTIYDLVETGKIPTELNLPSRPQYVAFHPSGRKLAISQPKGVEVRELDTGKVLESWPLDREVRGLAWRSDGKILAVASGATINLWSENSTRPLAILRGHEGVVTEVAFSNAGDLLASKAHDGTVRLWDIAGLRQLVRAPCVYTGCSPLQFSADDQRLGFGSDGARLWLWEVAAGRECRTLWIPQSGNWNSMMGHFSPDNRLLAAGDNRGIRIWDLEAGKEVAFAAAPETWSVHFALDGRELITTGKEGLQRWPIAADLKTGALRLGPSEVLYPKPLQRAKLSRDGRVVVTRPADGGALIVPRDNPKRTVSINDHRELTYVAASPDGELAATGTWYGSGVRLWKTANGEMFRELPGFGSATVTFSPNGRWFVIGTDRQYEFWDTQEWQRRHAVSKQPEIGPGGVAFSGDAALVVVRHSTTQLRLLDPESGRQLAELQPPDQRTLLWHSLSDDGRWLAAASPGGAVHIWDLQLIRRHLANRGLDW